jgi:hypothetical protein
MTESIGRRATDTKINQKIDAVIIDLNDCRRGVHNILDGMSGRIDIISKDLASHKNDVAELSSELQNVVKSLTSIHDILVAWNNTQGFINVMKFLSGSAKVIAPILFIGAAIVAATTYLYHKVWP